MPDAPPDHSPRSLEHRTNFLLSLLVVAGIAAVAYTDLVVQSHVSLGYLFLLPLAFSALVHRLRFTLVLVVLCTILQDLLGPFPHGGWVFLARNLVTFAGYLSVVLLANRLGRQRQELFDTVRSQRDQMEKDLSLAAQVQRQLLPRRPLLLPSLEVAGRVVPARTVSGDFYDYTPLPDGSVGFVIADVSGKGPAAALLMTPVQAVLRLRAPDSAPPAEVMQDLNQIFLQIMGRARYVTLFYGRLHPQKRWLEYANAGHEPPFLFRPRTGQVLWLNKGGLVLGLMPEVRYESGAVALEAGDLLVLYTDGVSDAENERGEAFTRRRLPGLVATLERRSAVEVVEAIHRAVAEFRGPRPQEDDTTVIVLRLL